MKMTQNHYNSMLEDMQAAYRLFENTFQMLPEEECEIAYRGQLALQDLADYVQNHVEIVK